MASSSNCEIYWTLQSSVSAIYCNICNTLRSFVYAWPPTQVAYWTKNEEKIHTKISENNDKNGIFYDRKLKK